MEVMEAVEIEKEAFATAAKEDEQWPRPRKNREEGQRKASEKFTQWCGTTRARGVRRTGNETLAWKDQVRRAQGSKGGGDSEVPVLAHAMEPGGKVIAQKRSPMAPDTVETGPTKPTATRRCPKRVGKHGKVQFDLRGADNDQS